MKHKSIVTAYILFLLAIATAISGGKAVIAQGSPPGDPWSCNGNMYIIQGSPNAITLSKVHTTTDPWTLETLLSFNFEFNALGFNPVDNYMYGMHPSNGNVYKIGQAGAVDLGVPTNYPSGNPYYWGAGTIVFTPGTPPSNPRYIVAQDRQPFSLLEIDLSTNPISVVRSHSLLGRYTDIAFNPADGYIYGVRQRNGDDTTYKIDPSPSNFGAETRVGSDGSAGQNGIWAAAFGDSQGNMYFYQLANNSAYDPVGFYLADLGTGALTFKYSAGTWQRSDGANCPATPIQRDTDFGDLPNDPNDAYYNYPSAQHIILDSAPRLGSKVDYEDAEQPTADANGDDSQGDSDEDGVKRADAGGPNHGWKNGSRGGALTIDVQNKQGYVQVWMDFDGSGLVPVTLKDSSGATISQPMAVGSHTVYVDIPANTFNGSNPRTIFTRVRISSAGGLSVDGAADDGEVEDYKLNFGPNAVSLLNFSPRETALPRSAGLILLAGILLALGAGGVFLSRRIWL